MVARATFLHKRNCHLTATFCIGTSVLCYRLLSSQRVPETMLLSNTTTSGQRTVVIREYCSKRDAQRLEIIQFYFETVLLIL